MIADVISKLISDNVDDVAVDQVLSDLDGEKTLENTLVVVDVDDDLEMRGFVQGVFESEIEMTIISANLDERNRVYKALRDLLDKQIIPSANILSSEFFTIDNYKTDGYYYSDITMNVRYK